MSLEEKIKKLETLISYPKREYIEILFGNAWEVEIHKIDGTVWGISKKSLEDALDKALKTYQANLKK